MSKNHLKWTKVKDGLPEGIMSEATDEEMLIGIDAPLALVPSFLAPSFKIKEEK